MREAAVERSTKETRITARMTVPGDGGGTIRTGVGFLDHMLQLFAKHGGFQLELTCEGDLHVDCHHTVEDTGIVLGMLLAQIMGDRSGLRRYGSMLLPMDEALCRAVIDLSGRPYLVFDTPPLTQTPHLGNFDAETAEEFFRAVASRCGMTLHLAVLYGKNTHHMIEGLFKAFAHALREALTVDETVQGVLSTKGCL